MACPRNDEHPAVQKRMATHPRFEMHFKPTSTSWLNMSSASSAISRLIDCATGYEQACRI